MKRIYNPETKDYDVVPSEGYAPNRVLTVDADGNPLWSDELSRLSKEKTHYSDSINYEWDGNDSDPNYDAQQGLVFITDSITRIRQLDGLSAVLSVWWPGDNGYQKLDSEAVKIDTANAQDIGNGMYAYDVVVDIPEAQLEGYAGLVVYSTEISNPDGSTIKPGLYATKRTGEREVFVSKLYGEYVVKTLDPKYLPKPIPAEYLPATAVVITKQNGVVSCNTPLENIPASIMKGTPWIFVRDDGEYLQSWSDVSPSYVKAENVCFINVYGGDGSYFTGFEYNANGITESVDG